ncbi:MAG: hypothetical protein Kow0080_21630 [Candidatus Promineifilaceae bacterium]
MARGATKLGDDIYDYTRTAAHGRKSGLTAHSAHAMMLDGYLILKKEVERMSNVFTNIFRLRLTVSGTVGACMRLRPFTEH